MNRLKLQCHCTSKRHDNVEQRRKRKKINETPPSFADSLKEKLICLLKNDVYEDKEFWLELEKH